ncbi:ABC transporter substrate-binding protein [Ferrovibrio sp.]|jgi:peptide/nickel transport system substrate-binding protein|uniref:ABC transporter substrate-binding protein n=1 Tax=Ferrovibrio sp. TaxID=1917215 RepID=UPI0035ADE9A6
MFRHATYAAFAALLLVAAAPASAQTLKFGLAEDPDALDPTLARTFVGRVVFSALCDKLVDISPDLKVVPQLATEWSWSADNKSLTFKLRPGVTFHDGEKFDAEAVKYNIERHKTMQGSQRRGELSAVTSVDVVDPLTVKLNTAAPFAPLLATLTDRAGMMISPKAGQALGDKFATAPVCAGPYKFVERVAQDRIVVEKYDGYWNKANVHIQRIEFRPFIDATVRLANLRSGQLDILERLAATDAPSVQKDNKLKLGSVTEIGYYGITINIGKSDKAKTSALGSNAKIREAFELSLDRNGINKVVFDGQATPGNQWVAPNSPYYAKSSPIPKRDVAKAKALLKEAGNPNPVVNLVTPTTTDARNIAQVVQAMAKEAGFDVRIQATEFATSLNMADKGDFEAYILAWSGRPDPDGNLYSFHGCKQPLNYSGLCNPALDEILNDSRLTNDMAQRQAAWNKAAAIVLAERPIIYLLHRKWLWAYNTKLSGFKEYPDGLIRFTGMKLG